MSRNSICIKLRITLSYRKKRLHISAAISGGAGWRLLAGVFFTQNADALFMDARCSGANHNEPYLVYDGSYKNRDICSEVFMTNEIFYGIMK